MLLSLLLLLLMKMSLLGSLWLWLCYTIQWSAPAQARSKKNGLGQDANQSNLEPRITWHSERGMSKYALTPNKGLMVDGSAEGTKLGESSSVELFIWIWVKGHLQQEQRWLKKSCIAKGPLKPGWQFMKAVNLEHTAQPVGRSTFLENILSSWPSWSQPLLGRLGLSESLESHHL